MNEMLGFHVTSLKADKIIGLSHPEMRSLFEDLILSEIE